MRTVQIYVNNVRLDLFDDEKIEVTSTIQNVKDISKVFTDFSQSFTVPASKVNNGVFDHYYNNDVNGTFIAKERAPAKIEINHTPFRVGKVQLEGAEIKNNQVESYRITFFGDVVTLKDKFGEDKLSDLDYSSIQVEYTGPDILTSLTSPSDDDVRYPLISSNRIWQYGDASVEDISDSNYPIVFDELFPALKVSKIFELIATEYGLTFTGNFLSSKKFTNMFTWWKNRKITDFDLEPIDITFDVSGSIIWTSNQAVLTYIDPSTITPPAGYTIYPNTNVGGWVGMHMYHYCDNVGSSYSIDVYSNGVLYQTFDYTVTATDYQGDAYVQFQNVELYNGFSYSTRFLTYKVRSTDEVTIEKVEFKHTFRYYAYLTSSGVNALQFTEETNLFQTSGDLDEPYILQPYLDFSGTAPNIKVSDYFSGILSTFNLTCFPLQDGETFHIEPLDVWYAAGGEVDITPYTIIDSIKIDRPKLHKSISFEYAKSKSFMNTNFEGAFDRGYGNLKSTFDFDGSDFKIKLPFENLLFNKFDGENLQVGYSCTSPELNKSYVPKVTNLYLDESTSCSFQFNNGAATAEVQTYVPLGQDLVFNNENYSSNFGLDISTLKGTSITNSLYKTYYEPYLLNLFQDKTRRVTVECIMPLSTLTLLTLDDAIILRDKKYRIDSMKTDLTSGKVTLVLLSDWVKRGASQVIRPTDEPLDDGAGTVCIPIKPIKPIRPTKPYKGGGGYVIVSAPTESSFVTGTPTLPATFTEEGEICLARTANTTGAERTNTMDVTYYNPDGTIIRTDSLLLVQDYDKSYLLKEDGGYLLTESYDKIILE
jgi:hypothetical protein